MLNGKEKCEKKINSLENQVETLDSTIKDELYTIFMAKLGEPEENKSLKKENKKLRLQNQQLKEIIKEGKKMRLAIVSQDKRTVWDYSQCMVTISKDLKDIVIRPYQENNGYLLAHYEDPQQATKTLNEMINVFSKSKILIRPKCNLKLENLEMAKKYYEDLNNERISLINNDFEIVTYNTSGVITYEFPKDIGDNKQ